jgi:hypothetical protein
MDCRFEANEGEARVRALGWCYEHKMSCGYQPQRKSIKIRARDGEIIDLEDIRKEHAILIKHNTALLDALEAILRLEPGSSGAWICSDCAKTARETAGVVKEEA